MALWQTVSRIFRPASGRVTAATVERCASVPGTSSTAAAAQPQRRITLAEQFGKLSRFVETATTNATAVQRSHATARERLDATELSLRRMLADIESIMAVRPLKSLAMPVSRDETQTVRIALAA